MEIGTIELSAEQAENVICNVRQKAGGLAMEIPATNGCISLIMDIKLRKLPVKFRGGKKQSKAFRLKGPVESLRRITGYIPGKWTMDIKKEDEAE